MNIQTENMIKDTKIYQLSITKKWSIIWEYKSSRKFLTIDNTFTDCENFLKFKYELDAKTYLAVLKDNINV